MLEIIEMYNGKFQICICKKYCTKMLLLAKSIFLTHVKVSNLTYNYTSQNQTRLL